MNTIVRVVLMCGLIVAPLSVATAGDEPAGDARKGKYGYRGVYKACLKRGEVDSDKPLQDPSSKTRAQWVRLFKKGKFGELGCEQEWNALGQNERDNILAYLWSGAADSPTPAKCK